MKCGGGGTPCKPCGSPLDCAECCSKYFYSMSHGGDTTPCPPFFGDPPAIEDLYNESATVSNVVGVPVPPGTFPTPGLMWVTFSNLSFYIDIPVELGTPVSGCGFVKDVIAIPATAAPGVVHMANWNNLSMVVSGQRVTFTCTADITILGQILGGLYSVSPYIGILFDNAAGYRKIANCTWTLTVSPVSPYAASQLTTIQHKFCYDTFPCFSLTALGYNKVYPDGKTVGAYGVYLLTTPVGFTGTVLSATVAGQAMTLLSADDKLCLIFDTIVEDITVAVGSRFYVEIIGSVPGSSAGGGPQLVVTYQMPGALEPTTVTLETATASNNECDATYAYSVSYAPESTFGYIGWAAQCNGVFSPRSAPYSRCLVVSPAASPCPGDGIAIDDHVEEDDIFIQWDYTRPNTSSPWTCTSPLVQEIWPGNAVLPMSGPCDFINRLMVEPTEADYEHNATTTGPQWFICNRYGVDHFYIYANSPQSSRFKVELFFRPRKEIGSNVIIDVGFVRGTGAATLQANESGGPGQGHPEPVATQPEDFGSYTFTPSMDPRNSAIPCTLYNLVAWATFRMTVNIPANATTGYMRMHINSAVDPTSQWLMRLIRCGGI